MTTKLYYGVKKVPKNKKQATMKESVEHNQIRNYGKYKIDSKLLENLKISKKHEENRNTALKKMLQTQGKIDKIKKTLKNEKEETKIKQLDKELNKLKSELKKARENFKKF